MTYAHCCPQGVEAEDHKLKAAQVLRKGLRRKPVLADLCELKDSLGYPVSKNRKERRGNRG